MSRPPGSSQVWADVVRPAENLSIAVCTTHHMEDEPRLPSFDRWWKLNDAYELAEDAANALAVDGLLAVRGCLSAETASELSAHIDEQLVVRMAEAELCEDAASRWFGNVYERSGRWDLRLSTESPIVKNALRSLVTALFPLLEQIVTCDAFLVELASVVSDPGARRQPFHSDTAWAPWPLYTIFIALQGIDALMGPTQVAPGTHSEERHHLLSSHAEGADAAVCKGDGGPPYIMSCNAGDGFVMDSRLYHCGGVRDYPCNDPCNHLPLLFGAVRTAHTTISLCVLRPIGAVIDDECYVCRLPCRIANRLEALTRCFGSFVAKCVSRIIMHGEASKQRRRPRTALKSKRRTAARRGVPSVSAVRLKPESETTHVSMCM